MQSAITSVFSVTIIVVRYSLLLDNKTVENCETVFAEKKKNHESQ